MCVNKVLAMYIVLLNTLETFCICVTVLCYEIEVGSTERILHCLYINKLLSSRRRQIDKVGIHNQN